jgi:hypothetical protein
VSACASKWISAISPGPCTRATPVALGKVTVWSPPSTIGHLARRGHRFDHVGDALDRLLDVAGGDVDVADVDHPERSQRVDTGRQMGAVSVHRAVVGLADRRRSESGTRSVGGSPVERGSEDHYPSGIAGQFVQTTRRYAEERLAAGEADVLGGGERISRARCS